MGVKYPFRQQINFDGLSTPVDIMELLKKLERKDELIFEYQKPHFLYLQIESLKKIFVSTITIAAKKEELVSVTKDKLIELLSELGCEMIDSYSTVHTLKEKGIWRRKGVD